MQEKRYKNLYLLFKKYIIRMNKIKKVAIFGMSKKVNLTYSLFKYMWVLVIVPKIVCSGLIFIYALMLLFKQKYIQLDKYIKFILLFLSIYILSILVRIFIYSSLYSVPATINTLFMWFSGIIIYSFLRNSELDYQKIFRYCFINLNILLALSFLFLLRDHFHFLKDISIFGNRLFAEPSWTNEGFKYRLFAFMEYPTNIATFYFINAGAALSYVFGKVKNVLMRLLYSVLISMPLYLSDTRSGIIANILVIVLVFIFAIKSNKKRLIILSWLFIISIPVLFLVHSEIWSRLVYIITSRQGSSSTRINLYLSTLHKVLNESPIIGMGIKYPNPDVYNLPFGSHSTYIGIFYRTGLLGTFLFLCAYFVQMNKCISLIKYEYRFLGISMLSYFIAIIFLDIDASAWVLALFFSNCAIINRQFFLNKDN